MAETSVRDVALMLAGDHMANDPGTEKVFWAPSEREVLLVEVSSSVEDRGELLPFRFGTDPPDVPFESVVILVSPGDWARITTKQLDVPRGFERLELLAEVNGALPPADRGRWTIRGAVHL